MTTTLRPPPDPRSLEDALRAGEPQRLGRALANVERHLREHHRDAHQGGGLLEESDRTRPALERREDRLLEEMGCLLRRAGQLRRRSERGAAPDGGVRELLAGLRRLRAGEAELAQEAALGGDLGAGD